MLSLWQNIGYTDTAWWGALQNIITSYKNAFHATPLAVMPDRTFIGGSTGYNEALLLDFTVKNKLWLQDNSLVTNRTLAPQFMQVPHTEEQLRETSATGDTLLGDIQQGLNLGANYILIFIQDIHNPAYLQALQWAASLVKNISPTPSVSPTPTPIAPTLLTPTVYCLGSCLLTPTPSPANTVMPVPSTTQTVPSQTVTDTPSIKPSAQPSPTPGSSKKSKHKKQSGGGLLQDIVKQLIELITKLLELIGSLI